MLAGSAHAQPTPGNDAGGRPSTLRVVPRDVNSSAEEWTESTTNPVSGQVARRVHRYTTFAPGLNYVDESGQLRPSQDLIELTDDGGAVAARQPHRVRFSPNLNTPGAITLTTPGKSVFRSQPRGLYYVNEITSEYALIAPVQDGIGELHPPNQVIYPDCLGGGIVRADYRVTCTKTGLEADLVLLTQLPPPEVFFAGANPLAVRLEWVTEFQEAPKPQTRARILKRQSDARLRQLMAAPDVIDETLDFGEIRFPHGRAFAWEGSDSSDPRAPRPLPVMAPGADAEPLLVAKRWIQGPQSILLVESVDWSDIAPRLALLPPPGRVARAGSLKQRASRGRRLPSTRSAAVQPSKAIRVARGAERTKGFVLDYVMVAGGGDYTFDSGTYYLPFGAFLDGTVTLNPNCVLKFNGSSLIVSGGIACNGYSGGFSILTSKDDDLFGDKIAGSTGQPACSAEPALHLYSLNEGALINGLRIRWACTGVQFDPNANNSFHSFQNSILEQCNRGLFANGSSVDIASSTYCRVGTPVYSADPNAFSGSLSEDCAGDNDSDGLPDDWEIAFFGNIASQNAGGDPDGDGKSNLQEWQAGTSPILKVWISSPKANSNIP